MADLRKIYPRTGDTQTVYLKNVVTNPDIEIGDYTMYHDFVQDPAKFERNNVLYHYPINHDKLRIGKFCSIACGARFLFNSANHTMASLSTYPFPLFWCDRKGSIETTQEVEIYFNFVGRYIPPHFGEVNLTPEELEPLRKKEERKDKLHQAYLRRKANGTQTV